MEGICEELLFDGDSFRDNMFDEFRVGTTLQVAEKEMCIPSSREMSSSEKVSPGISPRYTYDE